MSNHEIISEYLDAGMPWRDIMSTTGINQREMRRNYSMWFGRKYRANLNDSKNVSWPSFSVANIFKMGQVDWHSQNVETLPDPRKLPPKPATEILSREQSCTFHNRRS